MTAHGKPVPVCRLNYYYCCCSLEELRWLALRLDYNDFYSSNRGGLPSQ